MADNSYSVPAAYVTASMDISGANAVYQIFPRAFKLMEIRVHAATVTATATETMTVTKQPIIQSATSAVNIGTFPIVSTLVAGDEVRINTANIADTDFNAGEEIKIIGGNSTGTGTVYFVLLGFHYNSGPNPQLAFSAATKDVWAGVGTIKYAAMTAT
jgi:hypothetical protein